MIPRAITGLLAGYLLLATPARAEEAFDANRAWSLFADTCQKIIAAPEGAKVYALANGWHADAAATEDGWGIVGSIVFPELASTTILNVLLSFGSDRYPEGSWTWCMLQTFGNEGVPLPGIFEVAAAKVGDLLGPEHEAFGGPLRGDQSGSPHPKLIAYRVPGFPPKQLVRIQQADRITILNISRLDAGEEN